MRRNLSMRAGLLNTDLHRSNSVRLKKGQHLINHLVQMNTVFPEPASGDAPLRYEFTCSSRAVGKHG